MAPTVSVIIPNYNYARYLPERINSVLDQTFQDFEIIILDDCSTDDSREVIERFRGNPKVSRIEFNETNSGSPFVQWEKGLSMARGKYAWIAEADDLADPRFLELAVKTMEGGKGDVSVVMALSYIIDGEGTISDRKGYDDFFTPDGRIEIYDNRAFLRERMFAGNGIYNASMALFSLDAWRRAGCRDYRSMRYCGDWLFWIEIIKNGPVGVVREKLNRFRKHGGSVSDEGLKKSRSREELFDVKKRLLAEPGLFGFDEKFMLRYRLGKEYHCDFSSLELQKMGITRGAYSFYWIYKHWLRWLRRFSVKRKPFKPVEVIT